MGTSGARAFVIAAASGFAIASCKPETFACSGPEDCSGGMCQPTGYCSFPDDDCPSHQRYGDHAAPGYAGTCVGTGTDSDSASGTGDASTNGEASTTVTQTTTTTSVDDSETGTPTDFPIAPPECVDIEFDVPMLPGWEVFADGGITSLQLDRLVIDLPDTGEGAAGLIRESTDVAERFIAIDVSVAPDPASNAELAIVATGDGTSYGLHVGGGAIFATVDDGSGTNVLESVDYGDGSGLVLTLVMGATVRYEIASNELGELTLAEQPALVTTASVAVNAVSAADNEVDPGMIEIERLQDCPTTEGSRPR
ncbi:MAG TPA: hypothetical protein VG755_36335, partial [Nannocystaceae bacterium]|nr:hypothetical protein [Nannocystaceae bacterium]